MTRFIKALDVADKITDCIPVISTIKNAGVLIYRLAHRVDSVANPVNSSWKDDLKIHYLSKDLLITCLSMIPFLGNFGAFIGHIINSNLSASKTIGYRRGYLGEAAMQNNYEVAALYLARNPNRPKERLENALTIAAIGNSSEIFKLILDSRNDWSKKFLMELFRHINSLDLSEYILKKYGSTLEDQSKEILSVAASTFYSKEPLPRIQLVLKYFPNANKESLINAVASSEDKMSINYLFDLLNDEEIKKVIPEATKKQNLQVVKKGLERLGSYENMNDLMKLAAEYSEKVLEWLYEQFGQSINDEAVLGFILNKCTEFFSEVDKKYEIAAKIAGAHPNLEAEHIMPAIVRAAMINPPLFELFLTTFVNIDLDKIQTIFVRNQNKSNAKQILDIIKKKYPYMKAS